MFTVERSSLPMKPGVYLFKDQENVFLYIGKAKNLKKRILSSNENDEDIESARR